MIYYLQPDFGANVHWECKFLSLLESKPFVYDNPVLLFDLMTTEGNDDVTVAIPDLLIWKEPVFIKDTVNPKTDFFLASDDLANALLNFSSMPYARYSVVLSDPSSLKLDGFSLVVFQTRLSEVTVYSETSIQISSLTNPAEGEVVKGYCDSLEDFKTKMQQLISSEMKMIRIKEFAIKGEFEMYGFGKNSALIKECLKDDLDFSKFTGLKILENGSFNVINLPDVDYS